MPASQTHLCVHTTGFHQRQNILSCFGGLIKCSLKTTCSALIPYMTLLKTYYQNGYCVFDDSSVCPLENPTQAASKSLCVFMSGNTPRNLQHGEFTPDQRWLTDCRLMNISVSETHLAGDLLLTPDMLFCGQ